MKYKLHENGWTVILEDINFKTVSQKEIDQIAVLIANYTCVVAKGQNLTVEDEMRVGHMFKNFQPFVEPHFEGYKHYWVDGTDGLVQRVTGAVNEHGEEGISGYEEEFTWHSDHPWKPNRSDIIWLYGVSGTKGSRTTWNNNILSYNELSQEWKTRLSTLKVVARGGLQMQEDTVDKGEYMSTVQVHDKFYPDVVYTNKAGKVGLFFPFNQIHCFLGMSREESLDIINELTDYTIQDKYCYHHDWEDGDIVMSEQWLGIHKRWAFKGIKTRMVHRLEFSFPDINYKLKDYNENSI
jgi:alpha-ketoglutarate-dependent taurine dioxygenase